MNDRFQQFFQDLTIFFGDLLNLFNRQTVHDAFVGNWRNIRRDNYRQLPLLLAMALHLGVLLFAIGAPFIMTGRTPRIPEVYTVNLYTVQEAASSPPTVPKIVKLTTATQKKAVAPKPVKRDAVSLSPIRQRLAKERKDKEAEKRRQELHRRKMEQLKLNLLKEQAEQEAIQAEEALAEVRREAVDKIADLYKTADLASRESRKTATPSTRTGPSTGGEIDPRRLEALDRYRARITDHISPHWQLPELQEWDENLRAVIVMQVKRDGTVTNSYFEKRSKNLRFNQYVKKAIDSAQPLPPFPIDFHEKSEEIAVTFSPGGLL
ncbi:MAG: cell envelope integrity protein TolA [Thermodesulfobacteriota bacterium]